ncbi:MAG: ribbon-helix-helix protein, CopG family [Candidatus Sulfotelmatobacter sp.]
MVIKIVFSKELVEAADRAARRARRSRSALVRDALREHLRDLEIRDKEERDRVGYARKPQTQEEELIWEAETAGPRARRHSDGSRGS